MTDKKERLLTLHALQKCITIHKQGIMLSNTIICRTAICIVKDILINITLSRQRMI